MSPSGLHQTLDFAREYLELTTHVVQAAAPGGRQAVVLAGMWCFARHPFGGQEAITRQAREQRIDRAFGQHEVCELLEVSNDLETVSRPVGDGEKNRELERAAA